MADDRQNRTLVIVPAYNAAQHLPELLPRLRNVVPEDDLLIINDGSTDNSAEILRESGVTHITFAQNQGKGAALRAGYQYAIEHNYRSVLSLDADLQHLPEEVPRFLAIDDGHQVLIGTREIHGEVMPWLRFMTNNLTSLIVSVFSCKRVRDSQSGFRLIPTEILKLLDLRSVKYDFESEILFKAGAVGCRIGEVPISTVYHDSQSFINPFKDTLRFIRQMWFRLWL